MRLAGCVSIGENVAQRATYSPTQPRHYTTRGKNTTKSSAPEDGHKVARNMFSNLEINIILCDISWFLIQHRLQMF